MTAQPGGINRRTFLQGLAATLPLAAAPRAFGQQPRPAPSERISLGIIGLGSRGFNLLDEFLTYQDVQIVALCDVHDLHYRDNAWGKGRPMGRNPARDTVEKHYIRAKSGSRSPGLLVTDDFREVCERDDVDAVVIATPDHWHAVATLTALRNGKDVYCEKPVTHTFAEGQKVYQEVARRKAIFQTGSQQRSEALFRRAVELVWNGHIGDVQSVEVGLPHGYEQPMGDDTVQSPPEGLDYDLWCGPAPVLPYMRARHHRWWRGHRAYGGGVLMDWIGHHNDIAHWALGVERLGPQTVEAVDWTWPETDVYDTPHHYRIRCAYPGDVELNISSRFPIGTRFVGTDGWIYVRRGKLEVSDQRWLQPDFEPGPKKAYTSDSHTGNFLEGIRTRRECVAPAEIAHRSITPGHLGYVSHALSRKLTWDANSERVIDDEEANQLLNSLTIREPWSL